MPKTKPTHSDTISLDPSAESGQTLIEVIMAIAILALAFASAGSLATTNTRLNSESGRRTQAANLAARELEGLRSHRNSLSNLPGNTQNLWQDLSQSGRSLQTSATCRQFVMQRDASSPTGWRTRAPSGQDGLLAFIAEDDNGSAEFAADYEVFQRLVTLCTDRDFDAKAGSFSDNQKLYNVAVKVAWPEGTPPLRELTFRTVITNPEVY